MWNAPEDLTASSNEVAAHVVKSRSAPRDARRAATGRPILRQQRREDFNLIKKPRFP
jgi:hypothetical protein